MRRLKTVIYSSAFAMILRYALLLATDRTRLKMAVRDLERQRDGLRAAVVTRNQQRARLEREVNQHRSQVERVAELEDAWVGEAMAHDDTKKREARLELALQRISETTTPGSETWIHWRQQAQDALYTTPSAPPSGDVGGL